MASKDFNYQVALNGTVLTDTAFAASTWMHLVLAGSLGAASATQATALTTAALPLTLTLGSLGFTQGLNNNVAVASFPDPGQTGRGER